MALDGATPLSTIAALLAGLNDGAGHALLGHVDTGVPTSIGNTVGAYVALAGQTTRIVAQGTIERSASYYVGICYQISGVSAGAELAVAKIVDALLRKVYLDLSLGGVTLKTDLNLAVANAPLYQTIAGQEYRVFPVILTLIQRDTYAVNP